MAWPALRLLYEAGIPMFKANEHERPGISRADRDALLKKEHLRPADEIISEIDCLLYLRGEAQYLLNISPTRLRKCYVKTIWAADDIKNTILVIDEVLQGLRREARKIVDLLICKSDAKAYILGLISSGAVSYIHSDIQLEYSRGYGDDVAEVYLPAQATLDAIAGFYFRRFKGLELLNQITGDDGRNLRSSQLTIEDIAYLYKKLGNVAKICDETPKHERLYANRLQFMAGGGLVDHMGPRKNASIFQKLSPLFFTAMFLNADNGCEGDVFDWQRSLGESSQNGPFENGDVTAVHMASATYFQNKGIFFEVINKIKRIHIESILVSFSDWCVGNDLLLHSAMILRCLDAFEDLLELRGRLKMAIWHSPPLVAMYLPERPEFFTLTKTNSPLHLTVLMTAIISDQRDDSNWKFVCRLLSSGWQSWLHPSSDKLSCVLGPAFALGRDASIDRIRLRPIHLAGLLKRIDLFETLFGYERDRMEAVQAVAIAAVNNSAGNVSSLYSLLSMRLKSDRELYTCERTKRWLRAFVERYGTQRLICSLERFLRFNWSGENQISDSLPLCTIRTHFDTSESASILDASRPRVWSGHEFKPPLPLPPSPSILGFDGFAQGPDAGVSSREADCMPNLVLNILDSSCGKGRTDIGIGGEGGLENVVEDKLQSDADLTNDASISLRSRSLTTGDLYGNDIIDTYKRNSSQGGTKRRITTITSIQAPSMDSSRSLSFISLGGMPFLVPSATKRDSTNSRKRKWAADEDVGFVGDIWRKIGSIGESFGL
ncbi:hypothetical protein TWF730_000838 [Orbilia blumenaviensis]|uniref:Uncharacterized protein n=1 Tax=Orbilia blumenaviensis TaxID=1796055 RepID=A0AAV9VNW5_9PEZI